MNNLKNINIKTLVILSLFTLTHSPLITTASADEGALVSVYSLYNYAPYDKTFSYETTGGLNPSSFTINTNSNSGGKIFYNVPNGSYTIKQLPLEGTVVNSFLCSPGTVDLNTNTWTFEITSDTKQAGCSILNGPQPGILTIEQTLIGAQSVGTIAYNVSGPTTASPFVNTSPNRMVSTTAKLDPGSYTIRQVNGDSLTQNLKSVECGGNPENSFQMESGQEITCQFVNVEKSSVTISIGSHNAQPASYSFLSDIPGYANIEITTKEAMGGPFAVFGAEVVASVPADTYQITWNQTPAGWKISSVEGNHCQLVGDTINVDFLPDYSGRETCTIVMETAIITE
ncbi:hypothetical protein [Labrenzia sp. OB1]|uniref:hypothetical protein n=1 Tax=Labrenzia sp. OB1 TaxID=1561204 RepID=UPI000AF039E7|nr:hypothetical protein [Labrenzia sp. OB1]